MMKGEWKTRCGCLAYVDSETETMLLGSLIYPTKESILSMIPTFWDKKGNNLNQAFDLMVKRRGAEVWNSLNSQE